MIPSGVHRNSDDGRAKPVKANTANSVSRLVVTPASEPCSGSAIDSTCEPSAAYRSSAETARFVVATNSDSLDTDTPSTTESLSGTSVFHVVRSPSRSMAITRPRSASSVVEPTRRLRRSSTPSHVTASTPSITVRRSRDAMSMTCTSTRLQPNSTCTTASRPSRDTDTSGHAVGSGSSSNNTSSSAHAEPRRCQNTCRS